MWKIRFLCAAVMLLWMVWAAQAHFIWIERDGDGMARAYFGEWAEDVREKTGAALDRIKSPRAFLTDRTKALPLERRVDYIEIAVAGAGDVHLVEDGLAAREDTRAGGKTMTVFHEGWPPRHTGGTRSRAYHRDSQQLHLYPAATRSATRQGTGPSFRATQMGEIIPHRRSGTRNASYLSNLTCWIPSTLRFPHSARPITGLPQGLPVPSGDVFAAFLRYQKIAWLKTIGLASRYTSDLPWLPPPCIFGVSGFTTVMF
jgi:hypothetical protein